MRWLKCSNSSERTLNDSFILKDREHINPTIAWIGSADSTAESARLGQDYTLTCASLKGINLVSVELDCSTIMDQLGPNFRERILATSPCKQYLLSGDPKRPKLGDVRISFFRVDSGVYSVIGEQQPQIQASSGGAVIQPLRTWLLGPFLLIQPGTQKSSEMMLDDKNAREDRVNEQFGSFLGLISILAFWAVFSYREEIWEFFASMIRY